MKNSVLNKLPGKQATVALLSTLMIHVSCSVALFPGYRSSDIPVAEPVPWFIADSGHYLFNTKVDLMKKHFSGLTVIKPEGGDGYRVVMITETGLKIMDLEFFPDSEAKVHYVMDALNRTMLIKTLTNDFSLILLNGISGAADGLIDKRSGNAVALYRDNGKKLYYHLNEKSEHPYRVRQTGCIANKVSVEWYDQDGRGIDSIHLSHYNIALDINLYRIIEDVSHVNE